MRTWTIYGLVDPRNDQVRYVGMTGATIESRLHLHRIAPVPSIAKWIAELAAAGMHPTMTVLRRVRSRSRHTALKIEGIWIKKLYPTGLLNMQKTGAPPKPREAHPVGPHYSAGCAAAAEILKARGRGSKAALARSMRGANGEAVDEGTLANILCGRRRIGLPLALQMQANMGIGPETWLMPATK